MAPESTDAFGIHYAPSRLSNPGSQGGAVLINRRQRWAFDRPKRFSVQRDSANSQRSHSRTRPVLVSTYQQQAYVLLDDLITFDTCTGSQINVGLYGQVEFFNDFTIAGGGGFFVTNAGGILYTSQAITAAVSKDVTYSNALVVGQFPGWTHLGQITWALGGNTITGKKFDINSNHVLTGSAHMPGTVAGTTATGGQAL